MRGLTPDEVAVLSARQGEWIDRYEAAVETLIRDGRVTAHDMPDGTQRICDTDEGRAALRIHEAIQKVVEC